MENGAAGGNFRDILGEIHNTNLSIHLLTTYRIRGCRGGPGRKAGVHPG